MAINRNLPEACYAFDEAGQQVVSIPRGRSGLCVPSDLPGHLVGNPDASRRWIDIRNRAMGVTPAQREAMLAGSMFGWHLPIADPAKFSGATDYVVIAADDCEGALEYVKSEIAMKVLQTDELYKRLSEDSYVDRIAMQERQWFLTTVGIALNEALTKDRIIDFSYDERVVVYPGDEDVMADADGSFDRHAEKHRQAYDTNIESIQLFIGLLEQNGWVVRTGILTGFVDPSVDEVAARAEEEKERINEVKAEEVWFEIWSDLKARGEGTAAHGEGIERFLAAVIDRMDRMPEEGGGLNLTLSKLNESATRIYGPLGEPEHSLTAKSYEEYMKEIGEEIDMLEYWDFEVIKGDERGCAQHEESVSGFTLA